MTMLTLSRILGPGLFLFPLQVAAQDLPPGKGRDLVEANCTACHGTRNIVRSLGYSAEGWKELASTMVYLDGEPELDTIAAYLAEHFPQNDQRAPARADSPMQIEFEAWSGPTRGQRARDPVEAPDGMIGWTGNSNGTMGRLDPETGKATQ